MRTREQLDVLEPEVHLVERALELGERSGLVYPRVDQHDSGSRGDRPRVAMRYSGPRQRQSQPPESRQHPLTPSELSRASHGAHDIDALPDAPPGSAPWRGAPPRPGIRLPRPGMTSTADTVKRYFDALSSRDLDAALDCWAPGGVERIGGQELLAPDGVKDYFGELLGAFPDFKFEILELTTNRSRAAVRWLGRGTFAGPGTFQGFLPNGARVAIEGCDVLTVADDLIRHNDVYIDSGDVARQLGLLPAVGSQAEQRLTKLANAKTQLMSKVQAAEPERIADGVWVLRGGFPSRTMNVYLIEDGDGVTVFDAGIESMGPALRAACARFGGAKRIVLGNADADHRGAAPALDAPAFCHPAERAAAESESSFRDYYDLSKLAAFARPVYRKLLPLWDGGAVAIAGTLSEGDEVAGFRVLDLPGHAPGLIGLLRESDRIALVSDCFYTVDIYTGRKIPARVPHPAFDLDVEQARSSIRKLAELNPSAAWSGHADPVTGDVASQLQQAAAATG